MASRSGIKLRWMTIAVAAGLVFPVMAITPTTVFADDGTANISGASEVSTKTADWNEVIDIANKEGISVDSELYSEVTNSPGFHYAQSIALEETTLVSSAIETEALAPIAAYSISWFGCEYDGRADYPHVSYGEASVHGYWARYSSIESCPRTATVTVDLQAYFCTTYGCGWVTQNTDSGTFVPGPGSGKWATPHWSCASNSMVSWRGRVDVNLSGQLDPIGYQYSTVVDLACYPAT